MRKNKRIIAFAMVMILLLMQVSVIPAAAAPATLSETRQMNENQGDGIILYKDAIPHTENGKPDGTVDIIIEAMTTGAVTSSERTIPADIVLVLDVSGSMEEIDAHMVDTYTAVLGTEYSTWGNTYYGFNNSNTYYILLDGEYQAVSRANADNGDYYYYRYRGAGNSWVYVYPELDPSITANRRNNYDVYTFYQRTTAYPTGTKTKMEHLQSAVKNFIDQTMESNSGIANDKDKHRISIVKFADDSFYGASGAIQDANSTVVGNNFNREGYNYTQIVSSLTTVNASGAASLKSAVDSLSPAGATAIDYGLALAEHALFDARSAEDIAGRHEIVVLFTDGSPTHSNGYSSSVAAAAINNAAALKSENVEIYTISVAANADASQLGSDQTNQFCHYVSSNYPSSTASGTSISAGSGSATAGYYWVPDDVLTLDAIFETVLDAVGSPQIELGESAAVIDSLTPYFTIPNGAGDITLETVAKLADGWDTPVADPNLTTEIIGSQIKVSGFDFDANYVSNESRNGFYGKMLRITINVTPDYSVVDERVATIAATGGYVETNLGNAAILDSTQTPVAVVSSPGVTFDKVTYKVDGLVHKVFYRMAGTQDSVLPKLADTDVSSYSDWTTTDVTLQGGKYVMPAGEVVFNATSTKLDYTVNYEYKGTVPAGAPALPQTKTYKVGDKVSVAEAPLVAGYTFTGWQTAEVAIDGGLFDMPARNVTLVGSFAPSNTVAYKVEHYFQGVDGEFPAEPSDFHYHYDGTTGLFVAAIIMDYPQFTYADSVTTPGGYTYTSNPDGQVLADGSLVLRLYYTRNIHTVTYRYDGTIPANAPALPETESHRNGETVELAAVPVLEGYTFVGWASDGADVIITDGKILMPDRDVTLHGFFLANGDTKYKVEHYLESDADGVYETTPVETTEHAGQTGAEVVGEPLSYEGYTYNAAKSASTSVGTILADGSLVLKLYYDKTPYTVTYKFTGNAPAGGFPALPAETTQHMGDTVTVAAVPSVEGYTFHGWIVGNVTVSDGKFIMPDENVVFTGYFDRNEAPYTISHYFQNENGSWGEPQITYTVESHEGELVSASYLTVDGYVEYVDHADTKTEGKVLSDGSLALKLYYKRTAFKVTYKYEGAVPAGASALPAEATVLHGATVAVAGTASAPGYTFGGWTSESVDISSGSFAMPQADVVITGSFKANDGTAWRVEHYKETLDGTYNTTPDDVDNFTGITGERVFATHRQYEGFTPVVSNVLVGTVTASPDTLVLKLYYERNTYDVTYRYHGVQPDGAPDISVHNIKDVPYGTTINFAAKPTLANYTFEGWISHEVSTSSASFTMPAMDVLILGEFVEVVRYSVSYEYQGTVPADAPALPATAYYRPGEVVSVAAAPTVDGYIFTGWTSATVTVTDGKFDMPEANVVFKGTFARIVTTGTIVVNKSVVAPEGFKVTAPFEFQITRIDGISNGVYEAFYVTPGTPSVLSLAPGKYRVSEVGGDMNGFTHTVFCSKTNGVIEVKAGSLETVTFTNTYVAVQLEKDDHFGYIIGYPDGTVRPENNITRAEVATIFFRMLKEESRNKLWSTTNTFSDVSKSNWFNTAVSTLQNAGVLDGYTDGTFRPNAYITRAELVKIAAAFYGTAAGMQTHFSDTSSHWANDFIEAARELGIVDGYEDGSFRPNQYVTRAEAMKIINRTLDRVPHGDHLHEDMIVWVDNMNRKKWYYADVQEATNSHIYVWETEYERWLRILPVRDWAALELGWSNTNR